MLRAVALLALLAASGSCMEMRETVERMVVVRTTGSDLQPAATGYIYKKESDGPASVIKMGESEVMEHFSKLYEQPKAFAAPIPVAEGPFYAKQQEEKPSIFSESKVIPVVENQEEKDDHIDGIVDEDYGKIFSEYASDFGDYKSDFDDYLKSLGHFDHGVYREQERRKENGIKERDEHDDRAHGRFGSDHHYEKGGAGDYHNAKYETYKMTGGGGHKKHYNPDAAEKHYTREQGYKTHNHGYKLGHSTDDGIDKKDNEFYGGCSTTSKHDYPKFSGGNAHDRSEGEAHPKRGHDLEPHDAEYGKGGIKDKQSAEESGAANSSQDGESSQYYNGGFGSTGTTYRGKGYGYKIKH